MRVVGHGLAGSKVGRVQIPGSCSAFVISMPILGMGERAEMCTSKVKADWQKPAKAGPQKVRMRRQMPMERGSYCKKGS